MKKGKGDTTPAPAREIGGWLDHEGHATAGGTALAALAPLRALYALYKTLRQKRWQEVAWPGKAVSVDEFARRDARMPLFNFTVMPAAIQWWPDRSHL